MYDINYRAKKLRLALAVSLLSVSLLSSGGWLMLPAAASPTATLTTRHSFGASGSSDAGSIGLSPVGLAAGSGGALYGLTQSGGPNNDGTVFKFQPATGAVTALYALGDSDGAAGSLSVSPGGLLYGTEPNGGTNASGAVFQLAPDGTNFSLLYSFSEPDTNGLNSDGSSPAGSLQVGSGGTLYGETQFGGPSGQGNVFKIAADGSGFTVLHSFGAVTTDGAYPTGGLIAGSDGTLYGVTGFGGSSNSGTVFKLNPDGSGYTILYRFADAGMTLVNANGAVPAAALMFGTDGALYGETVIGGSGGSGVVFKIGTDGTGFTVLHAFTATDGQNTNQDGAFPISALVQDSAGYFYGTTVSGGTAGQGTVFRLNADGSQFAALYSLQSSDGTEPVLTEGSDGKVYGTTFDGGVNGTGSVFQVNSGSTTHLLWNNANGIASLWNYSTASGSFTQSSYGPYTGWTAAAIADGGTDGLTRLLWDNTSGAASIWSLNNAAATFTQNTFGPYANWTATALSVAADNTTHLLWKNTNGTASVWNYSTASGSFTQNSYGPYAGWTAAAIADGGTDGLTRLLWDKTDGTASLWSLNNATGAFSQHTFGPYSGWTAKTVSVGQDNTTHLLWTNTSGTASVWNYNTASGGFTQNSYGPYSGWTAAGIADGSDGLTRVLWDNVNGSMSVWDLNNTAGSFTQFSFGPYSGWTASAISAGQ